MTHFLVSYALLCYILMAMILALDLRKPEPAWDRMAGDLPPAIRTLALIGVLVLAPVAVTWVILDGVWALGKVAAWKMRRRP